MLHQRNELLMGICTSCLYSMVRLRVILSLHISLVDDGFLDVIIFKARMFKDLVALIIEMLRGEHLEHDKLYVLQD